MPPKEHKGPSQTGFWTYNGVPITHEYKLELEAKGVVFKSHPDGHLLPDGIHMKPYRLIGGLRPGRSSQFSPVVEQCDLERRDRKRRREYDALAEPKPEYFEWACVRDRMDHYAEVERVAFLSSKPTEKLRALNLLLEFSKKKPTQDQEPKEARPAQDADALLAYLLESKGIDQRQFQKALEIVTKSAQSKPSTAN